MPSTLFLVTVSVSTKKSPNSLLHSHAVFDVVRNAYLLINFGDFVDGSNSSVKDPFIQLLPTTDKATAHREFVAARLNGVDTTGSQPALLPLSQESHADDPDFAESKTLDALDGGSSSAASTNDSVARKTWFIVMISVVGGLILASIVFFLLVHFRRRRSNVRSEASFVPPMMGQTAYNPLLAMNSHDSAERDEVKYKDPF